VVGVGELLVVGWAVRSPGAGVVAGAAAPGYRLRCVASRCQGVGFGLLGDLVVDPCGGRGLGAGVDVGAAAPGFCLRPRVEVLGVDLGHSGGLVVDSFVGATSGSACCVGCCIRFSDGFPYKLFNFFFDLINEKAIG
jgi:hypothetical protein